MTGASASAVELAADKDDLTNEQLALQKRLVGSNINDATFLATDYLNHLNEAVMMIELIPGMPDMLDEALSWKPKSYQEHFQSGELGFADLACEAYENAPARFRIPFDLTIKAIHRRIDKTLKDLEPLVAVGDNHQIGLLVLNSCKAVQDLISVAAAIVNGSESMAQCAQRPEPEPAEHDETTMSQSEIDALFG